MRRKERICPAKELFGGEAPSLLRLCSLLRRMESNWSGLVGAALARRSSPKQFEFSKIGGVLHVTVNNSAALQDMNFKKSGILREVERFTSLPLVELRVTIGNIAPSREVAENPGRKKKRLLLDEREVDATVRELSSEIEDPALARAMARFRLLCEKRG